MDLAFMKITEIAFMNISKIAKKNGVFTCVLVCFAHLFLLLFGWFLINAGFIDKQKYEKDKNSKQIEKTL